jgi:nitrate reductase gamma subunit
MVYLAFFVFVAGSLLQIIKVARRKRFVPTLKIFPEQKPLFLGALGDAFLFPMVRRSSPVLWFFLMVFHVCLFLLLIGHVELIYDVPLFQVIEHDVFIGKGFVGLSILLCLIFFLFRRFSSPVRQFSVPEDYFILLLIFLTVFFGSQMDWARTWYGYGELAVDGYRNYLTSLVFLRPDIGDISYTGHSFMFVLHVFFANLLLLFFPFSKLVHFIFAAPMNMIRRGA